MSLSAIHSSSSITGPFRSGEAIREGWLTKRQLYSPLFRPLFHGVHLPAGVPVTHALRCAAASLAAPREAVLTGVSAAAVLGFEMATADAPVEFVVPEDWRFRAQRGMHIRRTTLGDIDSEPWGEIRMAKPLRMAMDMLTNTRVHTSLPRTVGMLDVLLRAGCVEQSPLRRLLRNRRDNGIVRARQALDLADPRAESIPESEVRVWLVRAGLNPRPQLKVYADGEFVGRLDLALEEYQLGVEYDGEWHDDPAQVEYDFKRRAALRRAGWKLIIVRKEDLYGDPLGMVDAVLAGIRGRNPANAPGISAANSRLGVW